jgi:adenylyltransferase/sulfurtransferase
MAVQNDRYIRQLILPEIGEEGQRRLSQARALVVGCGALGTNIAELLIRAGVGEITLVDHDRVELSNLQRQAMMTEADVGQPKVQAVSRALLAVNSESQVNYKVVRINPNNVETLIEGNHVVLDGLDNLASRYLLNDACVKHGIPWIFATVAATYGMTMPVLPGRGPCLRCLFPTPAPEKAVLTSANAGVINTIPRAIASMQTTQALKILVGSPLLPVRLINYDVWCSNFSAEEIYINEHCPCCGKGRYEFLEAGGI